MVCKGKCEDYKFHRQYSAVVYADGGKRCTSCTIFIDWAGLFCPCCGHKLRLSSRNKHKTRINVA